VSFEAAILGAVYAGWMTKAEKEGRIREVPYDPSVPVNTAWDLGYDDATAIWWWQVVGDELHLIDYEQDNGKDVQFYADLIKSKPYDYKGSKHYGPHDAVQKLLAARGRSVVQQLWDEGISMEALGAQNINNSIQSARKTLPNAYFDREATAEGRECLEHYHYKWDKDRRILSSEPVHDWSSHGCDSFELIGQVWQPQAKPKEPERARFPVNRTVNEMIAERTKRRKAAYL